MSAVILNASRRSWVYAQQARLRHCPWARLKRFLGKAWWRFKARFRKPAPISLSGMSYEEQVALVWGTPVPRMSPERMMSLFKQGLAPQKFVDRKWLMDHRYRQDEDYIYYRPCPICGQDDHSLMERRLTEGRALVAYCPIAREGRLTCLIIKEADVLGVIAEEERKFTALMDRFEGNIPERMTAQEAFRLRTQEGVPQEMLEERVDDLAEFERLLEEHRGKSGNTFRKEIF